jgi:hypothetical protein
MIKPVTLPWSTVAEVNDQTLYAIEEIDRCIAMSRLVARDSERLERIRTRLIVSHIRMRSAAGPDTGEAQACSAGHVE